MPEYGARLARISRRRGRGYGEHVPQTLPIFPLGQVLMPGRPLPLRIFEPRYREMITDLARIAEIEGEVGGVSRQSGSFGVVLLERGHEVESSWTRSPDQDCLSRVGTVAEILEVTGRVEDGFELLAVGSRRFSLGRFLPGKPYLRAEVDFLGEPDGSYPPGLPRRLLQLYSGYAELVTARTGRPVAGMTDAVPDNVNLLTYHVAATLPLPPSQRQELLAAPDAATRLRLLSDLLAREVALLQATGTIATGPDALRLPVRPN